MTVTLTLNQLFSMHKPMMHNMLIRNTSARKLENASGVHLLCTGVTNEARAQDYWTCSLGETVTWPRDKKIMIRQSRNKPKGLSQNRNFISLHPVKETRLELELKDSNSSKQATL
ncbi:hypothetical protein CMV_021446 [Castanea mollissima]|uniref:Uncharacterized protein n=1 Tax=Castanea mollissima TaxID=60419 RepID=A0A8J4VKM0_9ROSI|nr:hypothetical protein CMV_021446 [Castanea mollissima]